MATQSSTLAWQIPWMEVPGRLQSMGSLRVGYDWATSLFTFMHWRRKWNPLQRSCLKNLRDGRAWWAAVYGVAQSRTRLKRLSSSSNRMYGCESWIVKKAECRRIDAFELWLWRRLLRVPWTARRSNQSILEEIRPEYSLEGLILKLELQYFGHLKQKTDSLEKNPDAGKDWSQEKGTTEDEMVGWYHRLDGHEFEQVPGVGDRQGSLGCCSPWGCKESDNWVTEVTDL